MNHFFKDITWLQYAELLALALLIYYVVVGLRWYRADLAKLFQRGAGHTAAPQLQETSEPRCVAVTRQQPQTLPVSRQEHEALTMALLAAIAEASGRPYEPAAAIERLKNIICRYHQAQSSLERAAINSLVVSECKKTGIAQLSEKEVDQWWQQ
jgi:hypothetical protein